MIPIPGRLIESGNSVAVIIPVPALAELGWMKREPVFVSAVGGFFMVTSIRAERDRHARETANAIAAMKSTV